MLEFVATFRCKACEKRKNKQMESVVAPYSLAAPGKVIETDGFYWQGPRELQIWTRTCIVCAGARLG
eukprot:850345-Pyramimonas_sp.AAC.1